MINYTATLEVNEEPHWDAVHYRKNSVKLQKTMALELLNALSFKGNESILDVGCGDGKTTIEVAKKVPNGLVDGIDLSIDMITLALKEYGTIENISFNHLKVENLRVEHRLAEPALREAFLDEYTEGYLGILPERLGKKYYFTCPAILLNGELVIE